jgi:SAM-dependent methyltransferase
MPAGHLSDETPFSSRCDSLVALEVDMRTLTVTIFLISRALAQTQLDVPYLPTTTAAVQAMLKLAGVTREDVVYDLGCGDGRIVIAAAKLYGAHGVGIDIDPQRIQDANENARKAGVERLVRFEQNDLFQADIREASVVTLFLLTSVNARLRPKLLRELRPGTRVVSNTFDMGDWKPDKEFTVDTGDEGYFSKKLYLWTIPSHDK